MRSSENRILNGNHLSVPTRIVKHVVCVCGEEKSRKTSVVFDWAENRMIGPLILKAPIRREKLTAWKSNTHLTNGPKERKIFLKSRPSKHGLQCIALSCFGSVMGKLY